jgi:serine/threonine protein kinase
VQEIPLGTELGGYIVGKQLAEGGMGAIYQGFRPGSSEKVAIKIMLAHLIKEDSAANQRFEREIEMMRNLDHPNIVPLYAHGEEYGLRFFVMKLIMGVSLNQLLKRQQFSLVDGLTLLDPLAQALDHAHEQNLIHRDIKPANIMIENMHAGTEFNGHVYLGDFGLSKIIGDLSLTPFGFNVGTASYMAPEQILDLALTPRMDIYSLGIVIYEVLCGLLPFRKPDVTDLITQHIEDAPPPLVDIEGFPEVVNDVILRALAKNPDDRYATAGEFAAAYAEALNTLDEDVARGVFWPTP